MKKFILLDDSVALETALANSTACYDGTDHRECLTGCLYSVHNRNPSRTSLYEM